MTSFEIQSPIEEQQNTDNEINQGALIDDQTHPHSGALQFRPDAPNSQAAHKHEHFDLRKWVHHHRRKLYVIAWFYTLFNVLVYFKLLRSQLSCDYYKFIFDISMVFLFPMMIMSHFITGNTEVGIFNRTRQTAFVDPDDYEICKKCDKDQWKPHRAHHCSVCETCVVKMDHHCPLAMHCIGARNHKSFLLMVFYHFMATAMLEWCFWKYAWNNCVSDIKGIENQWYRGLICFVGALDVITVTMFCGVATQIFFFHVKLALENQTTLELMSKWMRAYDFYEKNHQSGKVKVTTTDLGILYNLRNFFGGTMGSYLFWLPTVTDDKYEGYYWPQAGCSRENFQNSMVEQKSVTLNGINIETGDLETMLEMAEKIYSGNTMIYYGTNTKIEADQNILEPYGRASFLPIRIRQ